MKTEIEKKVVATKVDIEKFEGKWTSLKLDPHTKITPEVASDYMETLKIIQNSWEELEAKINRVKRDLDHFGIEDSSLDEVEELESSIKNEIEDWKLAKQFGDDLKKIAEKKHIGNIKTVFEFQDFLVNWLNLTKPKEGRVADYIKETVEQYQVIWPNLKLMVGEAF